MRIKNNPKIFYLACGLIADGDRRYDRDDAETVTLAYKIQKTAVDANILRWFNLAKTGQIETNPYWPRGRNMLTATLFMEDGVELDIDKLIEFLESINIKDPIGKDEFREWIGRLPEILVYAEGVFRGFWKEYCEIIFSRTNIWMPKIEASRKPLNDFFGRGNAPNLVLVPNLFASPFASDFVKTEGNTITMIACKPDVEGILREVLHDEISKHRGKIAPFGSEYGFAAFANADKMMELGYVHSIDTDNSHDDEIELDYIYHVIEECFVRALSVILAVGGEGRMQSHINNGFIGVPFITKYFEKHRPRAENLEDFIGIVLEGAAHPK